MVAKAIAAERGCGSRVSGGVYLECGLSGSGLPVEHFLFDPPVRVDADALGLTAIGQQIVRDERTGVVHVFDIVGRDSYPNVADAIEEVARLGVSRRAPKTLDFAALTRDSKIVLLHARGWITNWREYLPGRERKCPKGRTGDSHSIFVGQEEPEHAEHCAALWWEDVDAGIPVCPARDARWVQRTMPSFEYQARLRPDGVEPCYELAMIAAFPISRVVVIADPHGGTHEDALARLRSCVLPVELERE